MMSSNGYTQHGDTAPSYNAAQASQTSQSQVQSPDQVGWYFVERYYTILNQTPDQVSLFYNKRSSLVWGDEGEVTPMSQGRQEISERIKGLGFTDCKVRVTNVDSQASAGGGILIQVLGEMSNNKGPNKKFVQTFFLAEQPNGYFVLNDIFRYLKDEEEEEEFENGSEQIAAEDTTEKVEDHVAETEEPKAEEVAPEVAEEEPEATPAAAEPEPEATPATTEEPTSVTPAVPEVEDAAPPAAETTENGSEEAETKEEPSTEETQEAPQAVEEPAATKTESAAATPAEPTPAATPPPQPAAEKPAAPPAPAAPPKPTTWASLLGSGAATAAKTVASTVSTTVQQAAAAVVPPTQTGQQTQQPQQAQQAQSTTQQPSTPTSANGQGWQSVSGDSRRHGRPTSVAGAGDIQQTLAYVKNVTENVNTDLLKEILSKFGPIKSFDPVKNKNCAFVEFETPAGFKAAKNASPLRVGDQNVLVEDRRQPNRMPGPYGSNRSPVSGQRGGDARQSQGRGGFQRNEGRFDNRDGGRGGSRGGSGRGGFAPRGRGMSGAGN